MALLEERFVAFEAGSDEALGLQNATIIYDPQDPKAVRIAVDSLADDLEQITGNKLPSASVDSGLIKALEENEKIDVSSIRGKWETFQTSIVEEPLPGVKRALLIAGSDKRGAAFGVYTLSEQSGQSPLHFWADVPAQKHDKIYALPKTTTYGEPSVKYRGLFINDEAPALTQWWAKKNNVSDYTFDSKFYAHVYDLILRLRGNFMWPAMWRSYIPRPGRIFFTDDPRNQQVADDYGIVISTSHHEPMQRASNEWAVVGEGRWDWEENKENVAAFMEEGVRRAGTNESYFTLGMRSDADGPIEGDDPVAILTDIMDTQRQMIAKYHGNESAAPRLLRIRSGPPTDVTLMFSDDNWGTIRRLPKKDELGREGGYGLYHHLAYVGVPKAYKWHNTNNLPKLYKELYHAYERGSRQIWILNVEDIKPLELPFSFAMDMAWNISKFDFDFIPEYLTRFSAREFGEEFAEEAASVLYNHSRLVGRRKYEMTLPETYSVMNYHEGERIVKDWNGLAERAKSIYDRLPEDRRVVFHHHALYPALAGAKFHSIMVNRATNWQYAQERRNSCNEVAQQILDDFADEWDLVIEYESLVDGKWAGMLSTPKFDVGLDRSEPSSRDVITNISYIQTRQEFDYSFGNLGIYAEGCGSAIRQGRTIASANPAFPTEGDLRPFLPSFTPYGPDLLTVDLFHRGDHRKNLAWSLESPYSWLKFSSTSGTLSSEVSQQRLNVTVDWNEVPEGFDETFDVRIDWEPAPYFDNLGISVRNLRVPADFSGFPEVNNVISIEAPHFQRSSSGKPPSNSSSSASEEDGVGFKIIPHLGTRSESGSLALRPFQAARDDSSATQQAWVDYDIYLFGELAGALSATLYFNGALDTDPDLPLAYSLTLDDSGDPSSFTRLLEDPEVVGDLPADWEERVADNVWKRTVDFGGELYLEKIVVEFRGSAKDSYLGPPETRFV
uniref:Gylcosyl hydrolase 115 C-terminal domain-containing protein n=1 Tax=Bionectria ochroleuca TaxID=29856 RepID=A0A8H7TLH7_BIOOC